MKMTSSLALEAIRVALTDVAGGVSYVWHRRYGELSGLVQPTQSFKAADGRLCRAYYRDPERRAALGQN
jgi:surface antigen